MKTFFKLGILFAALCQAALPAAADEIRLKDGKKLNGVIVAYEDNMFKVKTDYGYILVEKDKIAAIIPAGEIAKKEKEPAKKEVVKKEAEASEKTPALKPESLDASENDSELPDPSVNTKPASEKAAVKSASKSPGKAPEKKPALKTSAPGSPVQPNLSGTSVVSSPQAGTQTDSATATADRSVKAGAATQPSPAPPPSQPQPPANREEVQGNTYTNFTHRFRMYKAPSWDLLDDARRALPNAVVAMGSHDESTLLVVGEDKASVPLETEAASLERRLRDVYVNYRRISQEKTTVAGQPAIRFKYRGMADEHDWSGSLVVVSRGNSILTVLGMTYADTDLIQIQENVINRAISSLDFSPQ